jgi:hypothetical protein
LCLWCDRLASARPDGAASWPAEKRAYLAYPGARAGELPLLHIQLLLAARGGTTPPAPLGAVDVNLARFLLPPVGTARKVWVDVHGDGAGSPVVAALQLSVLFEPSAPPPAALAAAAAPARTALAVAPGLAAAVPAAAAATARSASVGATAPAAGTGAAEGDPRATFTPSLASEEWGEETRGVLTTPKVRAC